MTIRVLIVDDQPMYRVGVSAILNAQPDVVVVGEAGTGDEAVERNRVLNPDVVLMDIRMPGMNGIEATRAIMNPPRGVGNIPAIIMLTTFDLDDYVFEALRAGAGGFLLKDADSEQLTLAVRTVVGGDALLAPGVTRRLIEKFTEASSPRLKSQTVFNALTEREREIFEQMARGHSNAEIAHNLYIAEQTAKTHVSRVMMKLGIRDRVQAVVLAYETGLIRPGDASDPLR
jgi:DNA-binding NarL/FixJ family response regulator